MNMLAPDSGQTGTALPRFPKPASKAVVIAASHSLRMRVASAFDDIGQMLRLWSLVWTLSLFDIKLRYRGSLLGPFWLTLSTGVMIGAMGFVYAQLFRQDVAGYLPFLATSLVLWGFISTITAEGSTCLSGAANAIHSQRTPHTLHAARVMLRNLFVLAHNLPVIAVVFLIYPPHFGWSLLSVLPALALWTLDAFAVTLLLGLIGARFRDVPPIVGSIMQIAFYVTPIMWSPDMLMHRNVGFALALIDFNPFYGMLQILRGPLLGHALDTAAWANALCYSAVLIVLSLLFFVRARARVPYWV
ncbi:ABC transporter permease [Acidocella aminolytica]|jgi:lipopolysaccharide transport system permease protein|uniref:ABC transporter polysaccharide/O-antigene exporter n=1 Tax=Acidocella aminolytica 101 = DSM 11237 TaxID=1120923 RepID=A0A0D6PAY7_9PROT|nr:ABC transporter permease [Acidocella aminolytica]GAN78817.1 ABC transporter polysaccharide/O-antigene exporter [Acidocella aminolytica 101 = DSM 11237]GBQ34904.1 polysaccharide/O-antigen exporter permease [Acidocella aminolytica 101 = DSM 11237]SHE86607.1 lipopolysaccharide transport system permease protein [Acidocella aminolytica 101 = DSM 11237]